LGKLLPAQSVVFLFMQHGPHKYYTSNNSIVASVVIAAETCLARRYLAAVEEYADTGSKVIS
jgi:hypothetical protein